MKIKTAIVIAIALLLLPALGQAFTVKTASDGKVAQWPDENTAIFYVVGSEGPGSRPDTQAALASAFASWERKSLGAFKFVFSGQEAERGVGRDGTNVLVWTGDEWEHGPDVVAMSTVWFADETAEIEEVDIEFNGRDYRWSLDGAGDTLAIREVTLHEIGHLLGIDHSFNPGAVMHGAVASGDGFRKELSNDDSEALWFVYPRNDFSFLLYDLPVLFYPRDFPDEDNFRALPAPSPASGRGVIALGSADADGDGYRSEVIIACLDAEGKYSLKIGTFLPDEEKGGWTALAPPREINPAGDVIALAGVDLDRDGACDEVAVLSRANENETFRFYDALPGSPAPYDCLASQAVKAPAANNVVGMSCLDANGDGLRDELIVLRAAGRGGYSLCVYPSPNPGEDVEQPREGTVLRLPGLHEGSKLLGLAEVDADGGGEGRDLVVLEKTEADGFWFHVFAFTPPAGTAGSDIRYVTSARAPNARGKILPLNLTGIDSNRDGFFNELLILTEE